MESAKILKRKRIPYLREEIQGDWKRYPHSSETSPTLILTVIHARERGQPQGRYRIDWKLLTDLPIVSRRDAVEKLGWYAQRWKIETFHKVLKSGCKAEESRLRTAERRHPTNCISRASRGLIKLLFTERSTLMVWAGATIRRSGELYALEGEIRGRPRNVGYAPDSNFGR